MIAALVVAVELHVAAVVVGQGQSTGGGIPLPAGAGGVIGQGVGGAVLVYAQVGVIQVDLAAGKGGDAQANGQ